MLGAIYGDKAGSIHEYAQTKSIEPVYVERLITENSFYSDDTIETIAIIDAIINKKDYGETLKDYILKYEKYSPNFSPYFKTPFSPRTILWAKGKGRCDSIGNGAMMRVSPIGYLYNAEEDVRKQSLLATIPSHNSQEAIKSATTISLMIYYFRNGLSKEEVYKKLNLKVEYIPFSKFNSTCSETLGNCLYAIYHSNSFEEAIKNVLSLGGDTDTNACIVGSVAEAMYGMTDEQKLLAQKDLPEEFTRILKRVYK